MYTCVYIYIYIYTHMYIHIHVHTYTYEYTSVQRWAAGPRSPAGATSCRALCRQTLALRSIYSNSCVTASVNTTADTATTTTTNNNNNNNNKKKKKNNNTNSIDINSNI